MSKHRNRLFHELTTNGLIIVVPVRRALTLCFSHLSSFNPHVPRKCYYYCPYFTDEGREAQSLHLEGGSWVGIKSVWFQSPRP